MSAKIDELLEAAVAAGTVPGVTAVVADRDGVRQEHAAGRLSVDGDDPVGPDTMFRIASMTKAITTVAALQLVEQDRLDLDQPVASVVPAFGELQVLEGFDEDEPRLRPPATQATIRQLMTHTAGLGYRFVNEDLTRYQQLTGLPDVLSGQKALLDMPLATDPGTRWEYGLNTDWLGQAVEAVTGQGLDEVFAERILKPLGMTDTTFAPTDAQRARLMPIHARTPDGGLLATDLGWPPAPEFWAGGHGLYATAGDYLRFLRALLGGGELDGARILAPDTVELMFTPQIGELVVPEVIRTADPTVTNDIVALPVRQTWGLGLHLVLDDLPGMRRAGTGDWAGICNSYYWIDRTSGVTGAIFTQVLPFFDPAIIELAAAFEQEAYAALGATAAA
jgi:CubicO group peptidase (beta-lactamase class C family)